MNKKRQILLSAVLASALAANAQVTINVDQSGIKSAVGRIGFNIGKGHLYGCQRVDRIEFRDCPARGTNQWCGKYDVYDLQRIQHRCR